MERLTSLDAFRGATIASMVLVNNPGSWDQIYSQLDHSVWDGWTFTDLVFPSFLWMVGVSMTLSFSKRMAQEHSRRKLMLHSLRRSGLIFLIALLLNQFPYFKFDDVRLPGVLQRIAICYLIAAAIYLFGGRKGVVAAVVLLLTGYWMLMTLYPVPGFGPGVLTREGNFAKYIDGLVLHGHMWRQTRTWDPEGIVSTLPAIATTLFGILTGMFLKTNRSQPEKTAWLFTGSCGLLLAGLVMNIWMPINKNLWSSSYSVFMAGMSTGIFALFYWLVDVQGHKTWAKSFVIYGQNALAAFVFSGMIARIMEEMRVPDVGGRPVSLQTWVYRNALLPMAQPKRASVLYAVANVAAVFLFSYVLYRKKWLIRL